MSALNEIGDRAYFSRRAMEELIKAATCEDNAIARAHLDLADAYQKRIAVLADQDECVA